MSSKDKASQRASGRIGSHKPVQGRQHQSSLGAGGAAAGDKNAPSTRGTTNVKNVNSSNSSKKATQTHKKAAVKQGASGVQGQGNVGSSRSLQKFTKLKGSSISIGGENSNNLNEMATTGHFPSNEAEILHERFGQQETDVDDDSGENMTDNNNQDEGDNDGVGGRSAGPTDLLLLAHDDPGPNPRGSESRRGSKGDPVVTLKQEDDDLSVVDDVTRGSNSELLELGDKDDDHLLPAGWEQHSDKTGPYFWHVSTGVIQRTRPSSEFLPASQGGRGSSAIFYHDDEEINQELPKTSSEEDDYYESGAALTVDDSSESTFVVYPLGCCEFDETQLISATSSKAIQKCILKLSNQPMDEETICCWGLSQSQPILMKLFDDHIQFKDLKTQILLRSQPIQTIKTWAVDDNNNFAFVIEDRAQESMNQDDADERGASKGEYYETVDYALLSEPILMCYVFRSVDEDDMMSCKVAAKLNEEINRYREQMINRMTKSTRLQQMIEVRPASDVGEFIGSDYENDDDGEDGDDLGDFEATNELTMNVKYIGKLAVPRPTGIDVLNVAIDKCLAEATTRAKLANNQDLDYSAAGNGNQPVGVELAHTNGLENLSPLLDAKLHVSPSSVIVENVTTGEIIVECRIRYLTFMGISKRDIRWCGFIMQNAANKSFVAHCFECHPTAGHVCEAIQLSCSRMYEKIVKNSHSQSETMSIIPTGSKIRNTLAKTLSRIKLNPLR